MKSLVLAFTLTLFSSAAFFGLTGCSSTATPAAAAPTRGGNPSPAALSPGIKLTAGMQASEVEALLGRPSEIRPLEVDGVKADVWIYVRDGQPVRREVTTGMREVVYVDPISGRDVIRQEPIMGYETEIPRIELRLLMLGGSLVNWSQVVRSGGKTYT